MHPPLSPSGDSSIEEEDIPLWGKKKENRRAVLRGVSPCPCL
jgi:hypothetical protein